MKRRTFLKGLAASGVAATSSLSGFELFSPLLKENFIAFYDVDFAKNLFLNHKNSFDLSSGYEILFKNREIFNAKETVLVGLVNEKSFAIISNIARDSGFRVYESGIHEIGAKTITHNLNLPKQMAFKLQNSLKKEKFSEIFGSFYSPFILDSKEMISLKGSSKCEFMEQDIKKARLYSFIMAKKSMQGEVI